MSANSARVIDLQSYRQRRNQRATAPAPMPVYWVPVWVWVPVWRA